MSINDHTQGAMRQAIKRRDFLQRAGWGSVGVTGLITVSYTHLTLPTIYSV